MMPFPVAQARVRSPEVTPGRSPEIVRFVGRHSCLHTSLRENGDEKKQKQDRRHQKSLWQARTDRGLLSVCVLKEDFGVSLIHERADPCHYILWLSL